MKMNRMAVLLLALLLCLTACAVPAAQVQPAQTETIPPAAETNPYLRLPANVGTELFRADAWNISDEVLITPEEIQRVNADNTEIILFGNQEYRLETLGQEMTADVLRTQLEYYAQEAQGMEGYRSGQLLPQSYWDALVDNSNLDGIPNPLTVRYGFSVHWANVKKFPTEDFAGEDPDDLFYDRLLNTEFHPGLPLVVLHESRDGEYWFAMLGAYGGWVPKKYVALCADREEWLARQEMEEFLVVTGRMLRLPDDEGCPALSGELLPMGTRMRLVKTEDAPDVISDRWHFGCYVAALPVRDENGMLAEEYCLIPASEDVSVGYLPCTSRNLVTLAMKRLGDRYGWGGLGHSTDCCGMAKEIYACFGFELPRGVMQQGELKGVTRYAMEGMDNPARLALLNQLPAGSILCFPGHIMIYLGMQDGVPYCISAVGSFVPEEDETGTVLSTNSVVINTLNVKRRSGLTWMECLVSAVVPQFSK